MIRYYFSSHAISRTRLLICVRLVISSIDFAFGVSPAGAELLDDPLTPDDSASIPTTGQSTTITIDQH
jgi:hypothetical protein